MSSSTSSPTSTTPSTGQAPTPQSSGTVFLLRITLCCSIFLVMSSAVERYLAVCRPHHFRVVSTITIITLCSQQHSMWSAQSSSPSLRVVSTIIIAITPCRQHNHHHHYSVCSAQSSSSLLHVVSISLIILVLIHCLTF